jgi:hypothetical protein
MNYIERSGNPEFESRLPLDSREVSKKPKDEEAQDGEETSIPHIVSKTHGGAAKSSRGAMGAATTV